MDLAQGFLFSGVHSGVKQTKPDLALVFSKEPCVVAGCFTANAVRAAPVRHAEANLPADAMHGVLINSGIANALTGEKGGHDTMASLRALGQTLGLPENSLLAASTGMIGPPLPLAKIKAALPQLVAHLQTSPQDAAQAILTTDTRVKMASRKVLLCDQEVVLSAICKGSGMVAPQLATMIAVITTDCAIDAACLDAALQKAMASSFNALTVDGDMSTNDAVFLLANGLAKNKKIAEPSVDLTAFEDALIDLCQQMVRAIAADGEGATRLVEVTVKNAHTTAAALDLARCVAGSNLVKAAIFGGEPSWARVLSSVGARAGSNNWPLQAERCRVAIQDFLLFAGEPVNPDSEKLTIAMRAPEIKIEVDVAMGTASGRAWGCDLTYDYVKINADYSAALSQHPSGAVVRDPRLSQYTPKLKAALLVEALGYIGAFSNERCVIKYGGSTLGDEALKASFCRDILLLLQAGLKPVVVHGGGPQIDQHLRTLGHKPAFIDGQRVTHAEQLQAIEMMLTGHVNTELVSLMNQEEARAVGLSGKDGGLLRAMKLVDENGQSLGRVGEVTRVNAKLLELLIENGHVPVVSPIGLGEDGLTYNINADSVAADVASAIGAKKLIYLTDVAGILDGDALRPTLSGHELAFLLKEGRIHGGMKAKAQSILRALRGGVNEVHVIDGRMPHSLIAELFTEDGIGTMVQP